MNNTYELIVKSKNGDIEALYNLIQQYKILIKKFSYVNGIYDEDLNQYLKEKIIPVTNMKIMVNSQRFFW